MKLYEAQLTFAKASSLEEIPGVFDQRLLLAGFLVQSTVHLQHLDDPRGHWVLCGRIFNIRPEAAVVMGTNFYFLSA